MELQAAVGVLANVPGVIVVPVDQRHLAQDSADDSQSLGVRVAAGRHEEVLVGQGGGDGQQTDGADQGEGHQPGAPSALLSPICASVRLPRRFSLRLSRGTGSRRRIEGCGRFGVQTHYIPAHDHAPGQRIAKVHLGLLDAGYLAAGIAVRDRVLAGQCAADVRVLGDVGQSTETSRLERGRLQKIFVQKLYLNFNCFCIIILVL